MKRGPPCKCCSNCSKTVLLCIDSKVTAMFNFCMLNKQFNNRGHDSVGYKMVHKSSISTRTLVNNNNCITPCTMKHFCNNHISHNENLISVATLHQIGKLVRLKLKSVNRKHYYYRAAVLECDQSKQSNRKQQIAKTSLGHSLLCIRYVSVSRCFNVHLSNWKPTVNYCNTIKMHLQCI